jgi:uncharacterized protein DUF3606
MEGWLTHCLTAPGHAGCGGGVKEAAMQEPTKDDPEARVETDDILYWAQRLNVSPEELRSAVQKGGSMVHDVIAELERRGFEHLRRNSG